MERPLGDLFSFSKKEQYGILVLVGLIIFLLVALNTYKYFIVEPDYPRTDLDKKIALLSLQKEGVEDQNSSIYSERVSSKKSLSDPFAFDPNTVSQDDLVVLGFSEKQAASILRFRIKGRIKNKQDFKKIYVVNDFMYDRLEEFISIAPSADRTKNNYTANKDYRSNERNKKSLSDPFAFDPNTVSQQNLVVLGFSDKQAASIIRFREKGHIKNKEDFKKIYVVNEFMYSRLEDFITIDHSLELAETSRERLESSSSAKNGTKILDLNTATREELIDLQGIGPVYSNLILKYRDLLGGYSSANQLSEVYKIKEHPEVIESLLPKLKADNSKIDKRDINTADWKRLVSHPYIDKSVANSIIALREQHGSFTSVDGVMKSHLVNADLYAKIAPYLTINGDQ